MSGFRIWDVGLFITVISLISCRLPSIANCLKEASPNPESLQTLSQSPSLPFTFASSQFLISKEIQPLFLRTEQIPHQPLIKLTGVILKKPWTKSAESWMAGGSDYFVLDVGDTTLEQRSAAEGVILRPSDKVSISHFDKFVNQFVEVEGEYIEAVPYIPQSPYENYPTDLEGKPLPTGAGFKVYSIQIKTSLENL